MIALQSASLLLQALLARPGYEPAEQAGDSDEALMGRVAGGDHPAFAEIVRRHERWARTHAGRVVGDFQEGEDLAQEAFLRVWRTAPAWRDSGSFRAWFNTILNRLCIDHLRRRRPLPVAEIPDRPDPAPGPYRLAADGESADRLADLVARLPENQRMAVILVYGENLRQADAAAMMRLRPKAFESLLHRARVALGKAWESDET